MKNLVAFQVTMTGAAVQLPSNLVNASVTFQAKSGNAASIEVGNAGVTTTTGFILTAGGTPVSVPVGTNSNTNMFYAIGTANDVLSVIGV